MTVGHFLKTATTELAESGIPNPRLDILILLEDALGQDRSLILAHLEREVDQLTEVGLNKKVARRLSHTPLAYIRQKANFYGREFIVTHDVLVPRPETESIIDLAKGLSLPTRPTIVDVGTGSGCLGVTIAAEMPNATVWLLDISEAALDVARQNAKKHHTPVHFRHADLLKANTIPYDLILANLPYVPASQQIDRAATFEPQIALFSGQDGLDSYRALWQELASQRPGHVIVESFVDQHPSMSSLAEQAGYKLEQTLNLAQHFSL